MNRQVNLYDAKTNLSRLVDEADGETIIIAKDGKPMARLGPVSTSRRQPGSWGSWLGAAEASTGPRGGARKAADREIEAEFAAAARRRLPAKRRVRRNLDADAHPSRFAHLRLGEVRPDQLSDDARAALIEPANDVFVSLASAWELWIKHARKPSKELAPALLDEELQDFSARSGNRAWSCSPSRWTTSRQRPSCRPFIATRSTG